MAAIDQLEGLANIIGVIQGNETKTKTKSSQTTQTNISDAGVNKLIQDILAGPGGVRSVGNAARSAGLYNSTTEDMLLGDLYSRAATSAELARSPTTVTSEQTQVAGTPGIGVGPVAGAIGAAQLGKLLLGGPGETGLLSGVSSAVSGLFGGGGAAATGATIGNAARALGPEVAKMGGNVVANAAGTVSNAAAASAGAGALGGLGAAIPLGGSFLSGLLGGKDAATDPAALGISALTGAAALGPLGLIAAPIAAVAGGFLKDISVICTALIRKGLISPELHTAGDKYFKTVDSSTKLGYWAWGVPIAKRIDEGSVFWTKFTLPVVKSYLRYLDTRSIWKEPIGGLAHYIGEPACKLLGKAVIYYETKLKQYT